MNPLLIILGVIGGIFALVVFGLAFNICLLYTSPSPRDRG